MNSTFTGLTQDCQYAFLGHMENIVDNMTAGSLPISDHLVDRLVGAIISGELSAGARLTEQELVTRFEVSRGPLREALRRLEERQLLTRLPYCGVRVVELSTEMVAELYEIREALEGLACRRAAQRISPDEVAELRAILQADSDRINQVRETAARPPAAIRDFHLRIAQIAGSRELFRLLSREVWQFLRANYYRYAFSPDRMLQGNIEHVHILEALAAGDGELAEILMKRHIATSRRTLEQALKPAGPEGRAPARRDE